MGLWESDVIELWGLGLGSVKVLWCLEVRGY